MPFERIQFERGLVFGSRYLAFIAVIGSLAASLLMFILGFSNVVQAYLHWLPGLAEPNGLAASSAAIISVIEALDRFLIAIVLLYFTNGVYSLFIRREKKSNGIPLDHWLRVNSIGQLKQVVAEVIIVVLFVLFLRVALEIFHETKAEPSWRQIGFVLLLPISTLMLALALKLVELHPKPPRTMDDERALDKGDELES